MTDETLNITLSNLRDDLDMLLNAHYSTSEDGIAGMKERIASIVANIDTLTTGLSETNTKLAQDEATLNTCVEHDAFYDQNIAPLVDQNNTKLSSLWVDFRTFLDYFLKLQEKNDTVELYEKINLWMPYLMKLRKILDILDADDAQSLKDMLENGSTGGGTVNEELETQVNQNTANITALQGRVTNLEDQVAKYLTPPDPYYTGKSYTDYPAGTIIQTYDYDERKFNLTSTTKVTTPTLIFVAEQESTSTIKISTKMKTSLPATLTICTFLNDTQIDERTATITSADVEQEFFFEFSSQPLNTDSKANTIYQTYIYSGSNNTMFLTYQKTEVFATNIMFLNKLCLFNAYCMNGQYYLTDCSSGTLKTAEISVNDIKNINSVTWNDTGIPALECYMEATFTKNSDGTFTPDCLHYFIRNLDHNIYYLETDNPTTMTVLDQVQMFDTITQANNFILYSSSVSTSKSMYCKLFYPETKQISSMYSGFGDGNYAMFFGARLYNNTTLYKPSMYGTLMSKAGECSFGSILKTTNRLQFHDGTNVTMRYFDFVNYSKYHANVFIKYYDKIIKHHFQQDGSTMTLLDTIEFGKYDKIYEMPNNDYFAIKENKFYYYKML